MRNYQDTIWISYSAISAFLKCPRLYYMEYIYRNPRTGNRIQITNPYLSLGSAVHETIEYLSELSVEERVEISLEERFEKIFSSYSGIKGGFISSHKEEDFRKRGLEMVRRAERSPLLKNPTINTKTKLPNVDLFPKEHIKLVGSLDWIESLESGGAHIIDFKTGNSKESEDSLQLPIYAILANESVDAKIEKASYWYLQREDSPTEREVGDISLPMKKIKEISWEIKKAIEENHFPCRYPGRCFACGDYDRLFEGEGKSLGSDSIRKKDNFFILKEKDIMDKIVMDGFLDEREKKIFEMRVNKPLCEVNKELNLSSEKSTKIVNEIKRKLKDNLSFTELKLVIKMLR